jgi:hypothetical protein
VINNILLRGALMSFFTEDQEKRENILLKIPTINAAPKDFKALHTLWQTANKYNVDVEFDFSDCHFLKPNAVAFLGGLAHLIIKRTGRPIFKWDTIREKILTNLRQCGFAHSFGDKRDQWEGNSIPYREDKIKSEDEFANYLSNLWLGRGWVHVSQRLKDEIVGRMIEIYINAFEHAESNIGVFTCGQHFPKVQTLLLSVVDFGLGIPANVRRFFKKQNLEWADQISASSCIQWAFKQGTTTKPNGTGRGLGLDLLKDFIQKNHGKLEVYSHEGYACISQGREVYKDLNSYFEGTIFHITLKCDEKYYFLADENLKMPLF